MLNDTNIQFVTNQHGEKVAVLVPIEQWQAIQKKIAPESTVFEDLNEAIEEMKLIKTGKLKGISAKELLNEL